MQTQGQVSWAGKNEKFNNYSFRLQGVEKWFGTGSTDPKIKIGDTISFQYLEKNGRGVVDASTIANVGSGSSSPGTGATSDSNQPERERPKSDYQLKEEYWRAKEARDIANEGDRKLNSLRIQYQSARNAAIEVAKLLVEAKLLKLADAAKADNVAVVKGFIDDLTNEFYHKTGFVNEDGIGTDAEIPH